tara:strand:- start:35 stop:157 length:123 start_codon:yes stop_codon:yes gene_type:complete
MVLVEMELLELVVVTVLQEQEVMVVMAAQVATVVEQQGFV